MFKSEDACDVIQIDLPRVRRLRASLVGGEAATGLAETFRALGDPTRVRILDALSLCELCVCDLAAVLGLSQSAVSHQLRLLRGLRLVRARREGRMVFYTLDDRHVTDLLQQGLRHVEEALVRPVGRRSRADDQPALKARRSAGALSKSAGRGR
jgi:ArsR family transcriptional regulator